MAECMTWAVPRFGWQLFCVKCIIFCHSLCAKLDTGTCTSDCFMCCIGVLTWNVRLPPRGPGWDLSF